MTARGPGRFDPGEIEDVGGSDAELAASMAVARDLERLAAEDLVPTADFADRVMAAIATEPIPTPVAMAGHAVATGSVAGLVASLREAWRTILSSGRPAAVRAQSGALLLVVALGVSMVGGTVAVGAGLLLGDGRQESPQPSASPAPTDSLEPSPSPEATESPEPTGSAGPTAKPTGTPRPTATAAPTDTPEPTGTDDPDDTPEPSDAPKPTDTPEPTDTAD